MGTAAWFCDPQAPWQKGTVENTNKRAGATCRRFWISAIRRSACCVRLNDTPRKCLGFQTPKEVFSQQLMAMES
ncbi:hypothetical protein DLJ82_5737 (plasmid) [Rhizobium leguminosarum]|uniref:Transposase n=1 Tax=Rhizobium leguminosarum TaxID=384 RepID=A0A2Z4YRR5_RHILE|nr:hypothetical protein DLJ82_5737 [Rhizobium leguminosarum]